MFQRSNSEEFPCRAVTVAAVLIMAAMTAGCAQPARTSAMVAPVTAATILPDSSPLKDSVAVAGVSGGEKTDPLWTSEVSNEDFKAALELSLKQHTMLSKSASPLELEANLAKLAQPLMGFDLTVTGTVHYVVTHAENGVVFDETITRPYTADFSSAFLGVERLRLANEGAIRENIEAFIDSLLRAAEAAPEKFGRDLSIKTS